MKKQILLLIVAFMASLTVAWAQPNLSDALASCPAPTVITATCIANAGPLNPIAGTNYTYTANLPTPVGNKNYHWFVTTDLNLIAAGGITANREAIGGSYIASGSGTYNTSTAGVAPTNVSVEITWKAFTHNPTTPVLLVLYVEDAANCTNNNIEAFLIRPVHAFTLDIANLASNGTLPGATHVICVSPVQTATYVITEVATGVGEIQFNYGTNYMFFVVTAANYTHSWMPRFQVNGTGLLASRRITAVHWAYPADAVSGTWVSTTGGGGGPADIWSGPTRVNALATSGSVGATGECIIVRLTIANNQDETLTNETISLAVDGIMYNATASNYTTASLADIHHAAGPANECPYYDEFANDVATQILAPRPNIDAVTPTPFVNTDRND